MIRAALKPNSQKRQVSRSHSAPAPVRGWNAKDSEADMEEDWALELENIFPNLTDVKLRQGYASHSTGNGSGAVETLVEYSGLTTHKLIAAAGTVIYDASAAGASSSIATGKTNARWQTTMFTATTTSYLFMVNGADAPLHYDGSSFAAPTLSGVTAANIIHVTTHQRRLFFTFINSLQVGYLAVGAISGSVSTFDLGPLCSKGGHLMACGSWTRDGGSGPDDVFVAITSEGEVILYSGIDPGTAADWLLVGVFSIGKPIGRRCLEKVGADMVVITQDGAIPLAPFLPIDQVGGREKALSNNIQNAFLAATRSYGANYGWQSLHYPQGSYALFNVPLSSTKAQQYVVNTQTGAWCKFTNMDAVCWSLFNGNLYFGAKAGGVVYKADTGTADNAADVSWKIRPAFSAYGSKGIDKLFSMCRPHFKSNGVPAFAIDLNVNFANVAPTSIPTPAAINAAIWDTSKWDAANWSDEVNIAEWVTIYGYGEYGSPIIKGQGQITLSFTAYDMIWQVGNVL